MIENEEEKIAMTWMTHDGRSDWTRTSGLVVPNHALYQLSYAPINKQSMRTRHTLHVSSEKRQQWKRAQPLLFLEKKEATSEV